MFRMYKPMSVLVTCMFLVVGCKKEEPNPELLDPIYKDLQARFEAYTKNVEESKAHIPILVESLEKAEPRSIELKNFQRDLEKEKLKLMNSEQLARYYKIRAERRKLSDRVAYKKAFAADKPWPDPAEFSEYQVNLRLQEANRNWGSRVPKLNDRTPAGKAKAPAKEKAAENAAPEH